MTSPSRSQRYLRELPLVVGVVVGVLLLGQQVRAHTGVLSGSDWQVYLDSAAALGGKGLPWMRVHDWRGILHPALVAILGADAGYANAASAVSAVSGLVVVGAAALLARALAGSVAGGMAAVLAAAFQPLREASVWLNSYALQGATVGAAFALGAAACRWPGVALAAAAGAAAGLAQLADPRGIVAAPVVAVFVLAGATAAGRWRGLGMLAAVALGFALPVVGADRDAEARGLQFRSLTEVVATQQAVQAGGAMSEPEVRAACAQPPRGLAGARSACGAALRSANVRTLSTQMRLPDLRLAWLALALLIPARWGWRSLPATLLLLVPVAVEVVALSLIAQEQRYLVWLTAPSAALVPVACARIFERVPRLPVAVRAGAGGLLALVLGARAVPVPRVTPVPPDPRLQLATWARMSLRASDVLVDCGRPAAPAGARAERLAVSAPDRAKSIAAAASRWAPVVVGLAVTVGLVVRRHGAGRAGPVTSSAGESNYRVWRVR